MKVASVEQMRSMDQAAVGQYGISQELLMENAGHAAYLVIMKELGFDSLRFCIVCGTGNNGGDSLVAARKLYSMGCRVKACIIGDAQKFKGAAKKNFDIISSIPLEVIQVEDVEDLRSEIGNSDVIIDGIFGTGLTREVQGIQRDIIKLINECGRKVVSIDIPSGINGDTGLIMGTAVKADCTVTYGTPKIGNLMYPGFEYCGKLYVSHISFPPQLHENPSLKIEVADPCRLPPREADAHKGKFGDVLFIAGAVNYYGAPLFSSLSFLKAGGGYSRLAAPRSVTQFVAASGSEIVFFPQGETTTGSIALNNQKQLLELGEQVDMVVMGPGLSLNQESCELARKLAEKLPRPLVVDGDGLTALSEDTGIIKNRKHPTILTPHPGEMSRIAGKSIKEVLEAKIDTVQKTAQNLNAVIVLKGAHSLTAYPDGRIYINTSGNPGMATAGSGDVLTGTIAAMYGLGLGLEEAVRTGVFVHGLSADVASQEKGQDGITARDILEYLPRAVKCYREKYDQVTSDYYGSIFLV
ncbi:MAG: NAD(P)H-hydrate dehydratase [Spirochaetota bacterium]